MNAVRVRVNEKNFGKGVQSAKRLRGTFDSATKTWLIPASMAEFIGPQNPGLIVVTAAQPERCSLHTNAQGCPLHGEYCAK